MPASTVPPSGDQLHATRVMLRPIANPFALGFLGLAGDSIVAAGLEIGWIPGSEHVQAGIILMIFAPALQLIACIFGFLGRDSVAATGMGLLAGTWELIGLAVLLTSPTKTSIALGTFLMMAATSVFVSANTAMNSKLVPGIVMATTGCRFLATGLYELFATSPFKTAAGVIGCLLTAVALYGAVSTEIEDVKHHAVLPVGRRGKGARALEPYLDQQVAEVASEAGVRRTL